MLKEKPVFWVGSSRKDASDLPTAVKKKAGKSIYTVQTGGISPNTKPLKGFVGTHVLEISIPYQKNTYRIVLVVKSNAFVYILHVFMKKSKTGISTDKADIDLIRERLKAAEDNFENRKDDTG